jgi:hypothetical protein
MGMRFCTDQNFLGGVPRFRVERELVEDGEEVGRPKSTRTEVNIGAVADLVKNDRLIASRMIAESLNNPKTVVFRIQKEYFCSQKFCLFAR